MFDKLIINGMVIDGTGHSVRRSADVGIVGDRIEAVESSIDSIGAREVIDAEGQVVTPGFIDVHTHSALSLLCDPLHQQKISQGVTTEVLGNCGMSYFPLSPKNLSQYMQYRTAAQASDVLPHEFGGSFEEFRSLFDDNVTVNTAHLVAHGPLRFEVKGMESDLFDKSELTHAKRLLKQTMEQGAVGFSTGLAFFPQAWADTDELVELCKVVAEYDGVFAIHIRSVFPRERFDPVEEALEIARRSGVKLHFSHWRTSPETAGNIDALLGPLEAGIEEGLDITLDLYPYPQGAAGLVLFLPPWANEGTSKDILERLSKKERRAAIIEEIVPPSDARAGGWDEIIINHLNSPDNEWMIGEDLSTIALTVDSTPEEMIAELLLQEELDVRFLIKPPTGCDVLEQLARDKMNILSRPYAMIGSDSSSNTELTKKPHPRNYGAFPRFLGRYRRQFNVMTLETMIHHSTEIPARRFGLKDRGVLRPRAKADIVIFDPDHLEDRATYSCSSRYSEGVSDVMVNGQIVLASGKMSGNTPGRYICRNRA